jgi:hypothetical protein
MAKVKIQGHASGTGVLTVTAPNTSTDRTITLPDSTGTLLTTTGSGANLTNLPASGATSLDGLSDAKVTATNNIGLGSGAVDSITTGDHNVGLGVDSLTAVTSGGHNVGVGRNTLKTTTDATYNTAVGDAALDVNTTGSDNVGVGADALGQNTEGGSNVALGAYALDANTTASNNTAVGTSALTANTTGANNVAVGRNAGLSNTTASSNTSIGYEAGYSNALGGSNTLIGCQAGRSIAGDGGAGGVNNVCIGNGAGYDTNAITGGRWNIIIGDFARGQGGNYEAETVIGYNVGGGAENRFTFGKNTDDTACSFGSTSWSAPSDERYKKDIVTSTAGLSFINDLRPVTHKWKNEGDLPSDHNAYVEGSTNVYNNKPQTYHGFVAQEVKAVIDAHSEIKDGFDLWDVDGDGRQRIADGALVPILVKAIQELSAKNTALEARITTLEGQE